MRFNRNRIDQRERVLGLRRATAKTRHENHGRYFHGLPRYGYPSNGTRLKRVFCLRAAVALIHVPFLYNFSNKLRVLSECFVV